MPCILYPVFVLGGGILGHPWTWEHVRQTSQPGQARPGYLDTFPYPTSDEQSGVLTSFLCLLTYSYMPVGSSRSNGISLTHASIREEKNFASWDSLTRCSQLTVQESPLISQRTQIIVAVRDKLYFYVIFLVPFFSSPFSSNLCNIS